MCTAGDQPCTQRGPIFMPHTRNRIQHPSVALHITLNTTNVSLQFSLPTGSGSLHKPTKPKKHEHALAPLTPTHAERNAQHIQRIEPAIREDRHKGGCQTSHEAPVQRSEEVNPSYEPRCTTHEQLVYHRRGSTDPLQNTQSQKKRSNSHSLVPLADERQIVLHLLVAEHAERSVAVAADDTHLDLSGLELFGQDALQGADRQLHRIVVRQRRCAHLDFFSRKLVASVSFVPTLVAL